MRRALAGAIYAGFGTLAIGIAPHFVAEKSASSTLSWATMAALVTDSLLLCTAIACALVGVLSVAAIEKRGPVFPGALGGVVVHPIMWTLFVLEARFMALLEGRTPLGSTLDDLTAAFAWSGGSLMFGFWITMPLSVLAAFVYSKASKRLPSSNSFLSDDAHA